MALEDDLKKMSKDFVISKSRKSATMQKPPSEKELKARLLKHIPDSGSVDAAAKLNSAFESAYEGRQPAKPEPPYQIRPGDVARKKEYENRKNTEN